MTRCSEIPGQISSPHRALDGAARSVLDACRIVLLNPSLSANIGSTVRAMTTMGLSDLQVVAPANPDFRTDPDALARAGRAAGQLALVGSCLTLDEALADCQLAVAVSAEGRAFGPPPEFPAPLCAEVMAAIRAGSLCRAAFVFGTERSGFTTAQMARCQRWLVIPADAGYNSLNLSQAVQIVAFSLRQCLLGPVYGVGQGESLPVPAAGRHVPAGLGALEGLCQHLERSLVALGTLDPARPRRLMPRLRQLLGRASLASDEIDMLRGICRDIERLASRSPVSAATVRPGHPHQDAARGRPAQDPD